MKTTLGEDKTDTSASTNNDNTTSAGDENDNNSDDDSTTYVNSEEDKPESFIPRTVRKVKNVARKTWDKVTARFNGDGMGVSKQDDTPIIDEPDTLPAEDDNRTDTSILGFELIERGNDDGSGDCSLEGNCEMSTNWKSRTRNNDTFPTDEIFGSQQERGGRNSESIGLYNKDVEPSSQADADTPLVYESKNEDTKPGFFSRMYSGVKSGVGKAWSFLTAWRTY